jgi:protein-S-isoprenylcysteine O-methyltransferase Ste14
MLMGVSFSELISTLTIAIWFALIALWSTSECVQSAKTSSYLPEHTHSAWVPYVAGPFVYLIFIVSVYEHIHANRTTLLWAILLGSLCMLVGATLRVISIRSLGMLFRSHVAIAQGHQLVTTGLYARMRHPSETGLLLICIGSSLMLSSIAGALLTALVMIPLCLFRVSLEDKLLFETFGSEFARYRQTTPAMLPINARI